MSRLSEEILKLIEEKTSLSPLRNKEKERYIPPTAKDLAEAIADEIRLDEEEVKKAIICGLQEDSYDRKGVREYMGCTVSQISKTINKDCIVIGGKRGEDS